MLELLVLIRRGRLHAWGTRAAIGRAKADTGDPWPARQARKYLSSLAENFIFWGGAQFSTCTWNCNISWYTHIT